MDRVWLAYASGVLTGLAACLAVFCTWVIIGMIKGFLRGWHE